MARWLPMAHGKGGPDCQAVNDVPHIQHIDMRPLRRAGTQPSRPRMARGPCVGNKDLRFGTWRDQGLLGVAGEGNRTLTVSLGTRLGLRVGPDRPGGIEVSPLPEAP